MTKCYAWILLIQFRILSYVSLAVILPRIEAWITTSKSCLLKKKARKTVNIDAKRTKYHEGAKEVGSSRNLFFQRSSEWQARTSNLWAVKLQPTGFRGFLNFREKEKCMEFAAIMTSKHKTLTYFGITFLSLRKETSQIAPLCQYELCSLTHQPPFRWLKYPSAKEEKMRKLNTKSRRSETIVEKGWTLIRGKLWRDRGIIWKPGFRDYLNAGFECCYASFKSRSYH